MREQDRFVVIRASAGSGKTYALSNRYLALLRLGVEPAQILATTFTRKAAGEILGRVLTRLGEAAGDDAAAAALGEALGDGALSRQAAVGMLGSMARGMHRVGVSTIDAQMHRMAMCYRHELGLPAAPRLIDQDGPAAAQLRRRAIDAMLADDTPDALIYLLRRLHHDQARRSISASLDDLFTPLYDLFRQTPAAAWHAIDRPEALDAAQVDEAIARLRGAGDLLPDHASIRKQWVKDVDAAAAHNWESLIGSGIVKALAAPEPVYHRKPLSPGLGAAYRAVVAHARAVVIRQMIDSTRALHELLAWFDAHYTRLRQEHGVVLFGDLPIMLGGVIDDDAHDLQGLYYRLDTSVGHLLLDEFQDTAPIQWRVLRPFADEIRSAAEQDRTFFCVGDVKQAIYGWRGACAAIFERVIDDLQLGPEALRSLNKSWRSSPVVLDAVNRVFGDLANSPALRDVAEHAARWAQGFETHEAAHEQLTGYVELATTDPPADDEDINAKEAHLRGVADRVAALAAAHPARTIGLLVQLNATAAALLRRLRDRGVAASGEGGDALDADPGVAVILSALTLADHPGHTAAAFHVLSSPLSAAVGLSDLSPAARGRASRRVRRRLLDEGHAAVIADWGRALGPSLGPRGAERVSQLIDLVEQHEALRPLRADELVAFVRSQRVEDPTPARVRVMTVHRSKGLEFDVVVLGELARSRRTIGYVDPKTPVLRALPGPTDPPHTVVRYVKAGLRPTLTAYAPVVGEAWEQEAARRADDDLSAFYVAMTRAKRALHLLVEPLDAASNGKVSTGPAHQATPAAVLRHALGGPDDAEQASGVIATLGDAGWDTDAPPWEAPAREPLPVPRLAAGDTQRGRWWPAVSPSSAEAGGTVSVRGLLDREAKRSRAFGTRVHAALEAIAYVDEHTGDIEPDVRAMLEHDAVRVALSPVYERETLWRERRFAVRVAGELVRGTFDRVALGLDDAGAVTAATLTDWKTDTPSEEAVARYRPQLALYRRALGQMLGLDAQAIEARLVFVQAGVTVDV